MNWKFHTQYVSQKLIFIDELNKNKESMTIPGFTDNIALITANAVPLLCC